MPGTKNTQNRIFKGILALLFWLGIWELLSLLVNQELLVPAPLTVAKHLLAIAGSGGFLRTVSSSLARVLCGFFFGCVLGTLCAVICSINIFAEAVIRPFINAISSVPVTSFIILVMLWLKYTYVPVFIAALLVMPVLFGNVASGIKEIDKELLEVAKIYRFGRMKTLKALYIPSVLPYFLSGAFTSLGLAWKAGIAAEVLALPKNAIGSGMYYSKLYLETADLFAWTIIVMVFSFTLSAALKHFSGRLKPGFQKEVPNEVQTGVKSGVKTSSQTRRS